MHQHVFLEEYYMQCPVCDAKLRAIERNGVEIDICPGCKGIWLDRGEFEKLIQLEQSGTEPPISAPRGMRDEQPIYREHHEDDDDDHRRERSHDRREYRDEHGTRDPRGYAEGHGRPRRGSWFTSLIEGIGGGGED